jgi:hypothetical protein
MLAFFSALIQVNEDLKTIGALAGVLAVPGLAVLSLLYFGQAREVRRLREWAGRAPERAAELEERVTAEAQKRAQVGGTQPATPAAQAATATAAPAGNGVAKTPPAAPATVAAQAASSGGEKKAEEDGNSEGEEAKPAEEAAEKKADGEEQKAAEGPPAEEKKDIKQPVAAAAAGPPTTASPAATPAGAAAATTAAARARTPAPPVPPRPAQPVRASVPSAAIPPRGGARRPGAVGQSPRRRVSRGALLAAAAAVLVVGITLAIVLKVTGGSNAPAPAPNTVAGSPADQTTTGGKTAAPAVSKAQRAQTNVSVLNGTTITGLARSVANRLQDQGYTVGNVTDAPNQAQPQTKVEFGSGHGAEARALAGVIKVPASRVIALSPVDSTTAGPNAEVVVVVGQDSAR